MKNKTGILVILIAFLLISTACSNSKAMFNKDGTVTISREEYDKYLANAEKFEKYDYLKNQIKEQFLFEYDDQKMDEGIYRGLFEALDDPYSVYYNKKEFTKLLEDSSGTYGGIGIVISPAEGDYITVVSPIEDTPGERAGILPGDKIIMVDDVAYFASDIDKALEHMRGEPGKGVKLTIRRTKEDGSAEDLEFEIVREMIVIHSVKDEMLEDNLGYIRITSFDENTAKDFSASLNKLVGAGVKGVVLDLRNNPGGLLDPTLQIADELLPKATIVSIVDKNNNKEIEMSGESMVDIPISVLVNNGSASASEILSGALKDNERAKVIGTQTFGKGIVQRIFPIEDGGFKLTVSEYYTPDDVKIHKVGVTPDIVIELPAKDTPIGPENLKDDLQLQKAIELLK